MDKDERTLNGFLSSQVGSFEQANEQTRNFSYGGK
jgi:hypothetical protein